MWRVSDSDGEKKGDRSYFVLFPDALFPDVNDRTAILCCNRSKDALALLHHLMKDLLKGKSSVSYTRKSLCVTSLTGL